MAITKMKIKTNATPVAKLRPVNKPKAAITLKSAKKLTEQPFVANARAMKKMPSVPDMYKAKEPYGNNAARKGAMPAVPKTPSRLKKG